MEATNFFIKIYVSASFCEHTKLQSLVAHAQQRSRQLETARIITANEYVSIQRLLNMRLIWRQYQVRQDRKIIRLDRGIIDHIFEI